MGQAKLRGTLAERIEQAKDKPPRRKKLSNRELRLMAVQAAAEMVEKILGPILR